MGLSLRLTGISVKKGGRRVLAVDELTVPSGEVWGILGPNGAGKSTLLKVVALLERPEEGRIYFDERPVVWSRSELIRLRRRLGLVFQEPLLLSANVYQNVALGLRFRGLKEKEIRERVQDWLGILGLAHLQSRYPWELSGGEARKVSLARALVLEPQLLLLDEPFTGLDVPTRTHILAELRRIVTERHITVLFVTHDYTEIPLLADRVLFLSEGRIVKMGTPTEFGLGAFWKDIPARPLDNFPLLTLQYDQEASLQSASQTISAGEKGECRVRS